MTGKRLTVVLLSAMLVIVAIVGILNIDKSDQNRGGTSIPSPVQGAIDLQGTTNQAGQEKISLQGEWEFYRDRLLEPADFMTGTIQAGYSPVPSTWSQASGDEDDTPSQYGYGTYRLRMTLPLSDVGGSKSLFLRSINSAYRLWIDGKEYTGLGKIGKSKVEEQAQSHINLLYFVPEQQAIEIVIQVSNHSFREGGITGEIVYGDTRVLVRSVLKELLSDIFVIGGFTLIGLYSLILFATRRQDYAALLVSVLALAAACRTLFINVYLSSLLLGIDHWEWLSKLEYVSELVLFLAAVLLMKQLYPQEVHRYMVGVSVLVTWGLFVFILMTPARVFTETMLLQHAVKGIILLYFVVYVGVLAFRRKRDGAFIHMIALLCIVAAIVNDSLFYAKMIDTAPWLNYSIIPFILAQAVIVSYRYARISERNDLLVAQLAETNQTLEQRVDERTQSLYEANRLRTKLLVNIAHDLGTPLVGIQTYMQLLVAGKVKLEQGAMTQQLLNKTAYMQRLIHDLFELSKLESRELILVFERVQADEWLQRMYEMFQTDLAQQNITLRQGTLETQYGNEEAIVQIDQMRMVQVLQNYIDNAVKFSRGYSDEIVFNGYVLPSEEGIGAKLVVEIVDYGIGLTEEEQAHVFHRFFKRRERNEEGSGLGLAIVKEIVEQHNGEAGVRSQKGAGSTFFFALPLVTVRES